MLVVRAELLLTSLSLSHHWSAVSVYVILAAPSSPAYTISLLCRHTAGWYFHFHSFHCQSHCLHLTNLHLNRKYSWLPFGVPQRQSQSATDASQQPSTPVTARVTVGIMQELGDASTNEYCSPCARSNTQKHSLTTQLCTSTANRNLQPQHSVIHMQLKHAALTCAAQ